MELAEAMIKYIISYVLEHAPEEMNFFNSFVDKGLLDRLNHVMTSEFGRITYTEAVKILEEHNDQFEYPVHWGSDLQTEHEPRRKDRCGHGLPGSRHRRDHRRQPA